MWNEKFLICLSEARKNHLYCSFSGDLTCFYFYFLASDSKLQSSSTLPRAVLKLLGWPVCRLVASLSILYSTWKLGYWVENGDSTEPLLDWDHASNHRFPIWIVCESWTSGSNALLFMLIWENMYIIISSRCFTTICPPDSGTLPLVWESYNRSARGMREVDLRGDTATYRASREIC